MNSDFKLNYFFFFFYQKNGTDGTETFRCGSTKAINVKLWIVAWKQ